jgi:large subunit ribosomal protein L25
MSDTENLVITVERRDEAVGKSGVKKLRREGKIPAIVYGGGKESMSITVDRHSVQELLKKESGENTIFLLKLRGTKQERRAMIREIQVHPITNEYLHIDFIRVMRGHKLSVTVPIELTGDCIGVRHGGLIDFMSRELQVEVLPREMLDRLTVDIANLDLGQHIRVQDLEELLPASGRFLEDRLRIVVSIGTPRGAKEAEEKEEGEMLISEQSEPEVLRQRAEESAE